MSIQRCVKVYNTAVQMYNIHQVHVSLPFTLYNVILPQCPLERPLEVSLGQLHSLQNGRPLDWGGDSSCLEADVVEDVVGALASHAGVGVGSPHGARGDAPGWGVLGQHTTHAVAPLHVWGL